VLELSFCVFYCMCLCAYVYDHVRASVSGLLRHFLSCGFYTLKSSFIQAEAFRSNFVDRTYCWKQYVVEAFTDAKKGGQRWIVRSTAKSVGALSVGQG